MVSVYARPGCLSARVLQGARETPLPFRALVLLLASAARRFWFGIEVRACGHRVASMAHDPGLGASEDAVLIRNGDDSASGIAPFAVQDGSYAEHHHRRAKGVR
jgi:hypothetical protein